MTRRAPWGAMRAWQSGAEKAQPTLSERKASTQSMQSTLALLLSRAL